MRWALLVATAMLAFGEPPADVLDLFGQAADALASGAPAGFLAHFDRGMSGYATLREEIEGLLAANEVGSTIEVVNDDGDDQKRTLDLDWLLVLNEKNTVNGVNGRKETRRAVVKCTVERQGKQWKITALEPLDFFKY